MRADGSLTRLTLVLLAGVATALAGSRDAIGAAGSADAAGGHAVVLLYHHVADDTPASTSVSPDTFRAHLAYLAEHDYQVLPLSRVVAAIAGSGAPLPPRSVAISFDDAYVSVRQRAAPLLAQHGYPYAVFVSTGYIDGAFDNYLTWDDLRELEAAGAEIANHSRNHDHYPHQRDGESAESWRARITDDIQAAQARLAAELRSPLQVLAYPYGEFTPELTALAEALDFVAFGQQSGPVGPHSDLQGLPRFPMAGSYAELDGFAEKLRTRPFQVTASAEVGPILDAGVQPPTLRLRLIADSARLDALACFVGGQPAAAIDWVDRAAGVVAVTARQSLPVGRSKYTCTAPALDGGGVFYWYSHLWMVRPAPGEWYAD
jgi:peptidoglycan/xylan/chitin deacetylase (PgdA/CDA1 family)